VYDVAPVTMSSGVREQYPIPNTMSSGVWEQCTFPDSMSSGSQQKYRLPLMSFEGSPAPEARSSGVWQQYPVSDTSDAAVMWSSSAEMEHPVNVERQAGTAFDDIDHRRPCLLPDLFPDACSPATG